MTLEQDELERIAGALYEALDRARSHVVARLAVFDMDVPSDRRDAARTLLETIDGALADYGELVGVGGVLRGGDRGGAT